MVEILVKDGGATLQKASDRPVFLSGGLGDEIKRIMAARGADVDGNVMGSGFIAALDAPDVVEEVHEMYAVSRADVLTTDTFGANDARQNGNMDLVRIFVERAAGLAQLVADRHSKLVALSLTSSGDCYKPQETPPDDILAGQHFRNIGVLSGHGDLIIAETLPTLREGRVIASLAQATKKPFLASFTVDEQGRVLDGSSMEDVVASILQPHSYALGVGVNCCSIEGAQLAVSRLHSIFDTLSLADQERHIVVYPNGYTKTIDENNALAASAAESGCCHVKEAFSPEQLREILADMVDRGATIIGGCCGSTPDHTKLYSQIRIGSSAPAGVDAVATAHQANAGSTIVRSPAPPA